MWIARELARLVEKVALGFVAALAIASLWAAVSAHGFVHDFRNTCLVVGLFAIAMGAI